MENKVFIRGVFEEYWKFKEDLIVPFSYYFEFVYQKHRKYENNLKEYQIIEISDENIKELDIREDCVNSINVKLLENSDIKIQDFIKVWIPSENKVVVAWYNLDNFVKNQELDNWFNEIFQKHWKKKDNW